jgi:hypothetical protein
MLSTGTDSKTEIFKALMENNPVGIDGIPNCWCSTALFKGRLALVNIVKTAE